MIKRPPKPTNQPASPRFKERKKSSKHRQKTAARDAVDVGNEGDEGRRYVNFFFYLGYAINRWAHVDAILFRLFRFALKTQSDTNAAVIYYRYKSLSERFTLVDVLMKIALAVRLQQTWKKIKAESDRLTPTRNRLAHDPATGVTTLHGFTGTGTPPKPLPPNPEPWWELRIEETKLLQRWSSTPPPAIKIGDLHAHVRDVMMLERAMTQFLQKLPKRARRPLQVSASPKPPLGSAPTKKSRRNGAKRLRPPRSSLA
jgi:hypothetical protein